jgi:SAM-dependent methyltransferase
MDVQMYKNQDLKSLWSSNSYNKYQFAKWHKRYLPFEFWSEKSKHHSLLSNANKKNEPTILEIGSAMGRGYKYLCSSTSVSPRAFTGIEISDTGIQYCKQNYSAANWIQADFSSYEFDKKYDFSYERHAIHHMPEPMKQFKKILNNTNHAFCSTFRGCIEPGTVSDLKIARFALDNLGVFYLNIISVPDLVAIATESGFNRIKVVFRGLHEQINSINLNPGETGWFLDKVVAREKTLIYAQLFAARVAEPQISIDVRYSEGLRGIKLRLTQAREFKRLREALSIIGAA